MSTRNEIKRALRENTKEAFELITKATKASHGKGFTSEELARITGDRLSPASITKFLDRNRHNYDFKNTVYIKDCASRTSSEECRRDITVPTYDCRCKKVTKTYINVEDPNDTLTVNKVVSEYYFN